MLKLEREKRKLEKNIEKLQADIGNEKAKRKALENSLKELHENIKKLTSTSADTKQEHAEVVVKE